MSFAADVSAWVDVSVAARAATRENGALIKGAPEAGLADRGRSAPSTDETFPAFNNRTRARCRDRVGLRSWLLHREGIMRHSCRVPAWCSCRRLRNAWVRRKRIWPHRVVRGEICVLRNDRKIPRSSTERNAGSRATRATQGRLGCLPLVLPGGRRTHHRRCGADALHSLAFRRLSRGCSRE